MKRKEPPIVMKRIRGKYTNSSMDDQKLCRYFPALVYVLAAIFQAKKRGHDLVQWPRWITFSSVVGNEGKQYHF